MNILIKNGLLINPKTKTNKNTNIYIENEIISDITDSVDKYNNAEYIIDAGGKAVLPGLCDMHVHLREPGFEHKEDIKSGSMAAAAGGFCAVGAMPNTNPVTDNKETVEFVKKKADEIGYTNVLPIAAVTKGLGTDTEYDFCELLKYGAVAFSDDGKPILNAKIMKNALINAKKNNAVIISHCEDTSLAEGGVINEGEVSKILDVKGIPNSAEDLMIMREIILAKETGAHVHIAHCSTKSGIEMIREAKKQKINVTCETCPHYFVLTQDDVLKTKANAKMNPPLRTESDREAIINGLCDGTIDMIVTDHAPHSDNEKNVSFDKAPNGIIGLETSFALCNTYLVEKGYLTLDELICKMSRNPAEIFNLDIGSVEIGKRANLIIADLKKEWIVNKNEFYSKGRNTPFDGYKLKGKVITTITNGKIVYENEKIKEI